MKIKINDDIRVSQTRNSWDIQKKVTVKGVEEWSAFSYHSTIDGALKRAFELSLSECRSMVEFNCVNDFIAKKLDKFIADLKVVD